MGSSLISPTHLILLALACLLLFGAKRLPEIGRSLGSGMREFKDSVTTHEHEHSSEARLAVPPPLASVQPPAVSAPQTATERETEHGA